MVKEEKSSKETESLKQKVSDLENQVKRVLADYQNLQKRTVEEKREFIRTANKDILLRLLPVLDTLIIASKHSQDKSLQVSAAQFLQALKDEGVEKIETVGKRFDPIAMECVVTEEGEEGKVLEELRTGYKLSDIVLRVAQVKVGKGK
ncbi:MAG: nucleotide exchange factor GrpE [Candidatus Levybacteria bacterium]|nr:nucleotide exchange factor GrpE [Candidatus Levybacteria bacterium]